MWKLFGQGKHDDFRSLLINKLSPHLSSQAFDYWLHKGESTFGPKSRGLYYTGGSRHALKLVQWLGRLLGISGDLNDLCKAATLNEQREIWSKRVRRVLLSQFLSYTVIGTEKFLWKALGVPAAQRQMIEDDYLRQDDRAGSKSVTGVKSGQAIWEYAVNTLDPVVNNTLVSEENPYYLICLQGQYTQRCHPAYLAPRAHVKLSNPDAFDGLRIHTDELCEVMARMAPETLTIAVLMDSMDWFDPNGDHADKQVCIVNRALKYGGRVLLRSAGLRPWYVDAFEARGFSAKRVGARLPPSSCIDRYVHLPNPPLDLADMNDRVNMYASTWILTKVAAVVDE